MAIDLVILAILGLYGFFGLFSGLFKQLTHFIGLLAGRLLAKPLALIMTLALVPDLGFPPVGVRVALSVFCFIAIYVVVTIVAHFALKFVARGREKTRLDYIGGFVLGVGKGAILTFVVLSVLLFFERPLSRVFKKPDAVRTSAVIGLVRRHGLFHAASLGELAKVEALMDAARDPKLARELSRNPKVRALLHDPRLSAPLQDEALERAVKEGDWAALQKDPRIVALLKDPRIAGVLADPLDE